MYTGEKPETTLMGVIISSISIVVMLALIRAKISVGRALQSDAIIADAHCTKVCVSMSIVLLVSSVVYEVTKIAYIDVLGSMALAYYSIREARESFEKVTTEDGCLCEND